ncbi:hypothetical protein M406DRAFT_332445 [Cryphonectria parasitica EP155]|uniref:Uncharacterized protein n=1 Tax=Cryphonectria parasitica (strain ATCC 38755 / EP155) TaxID=660469 RepID=A0A9P4XZR1_CRYP1|nr:uncharacterized protein M406DRAFT_332445 [Cryphonectria parasitica EP155]KAF3764008.1 hypothetical protein M406DRAFT_332445 [Cryphonectria parasitica EP155]
MGINIGFVIVPVMIVIGIFLSIFLRFTSQGRNLRKRHDEWNTKLNLRFNYRYRKLYKKRERALLEEVEKRENEEKETSNGVQVWFSRYISHGQLKHWVLIINGVKYELRRDDAANTYIHSVNRHPSWNSVKIKRDAALAEKQIPDVDGFYICLIGWTRLSDTELERQCRTVMQNFPPYNMIWNNCQDFLKQFADLIISTKASDWVWFRENTKTAYQSSQELPKAPEALIQAQLNLQQHHGHHALSHQTQQQLINQLQIQTMMQANIATNSLAGSNGGWAPGATPGIQC